MKKLFTQKLKLCAALCALFTLACPNAAADDNDPADGYYYIYSNRTESGESAPRAWNVYTYGHGLGYALLDETSPNQIFYLKKDSEATTNAYYLQSLADGSWYYGLMDYRYWMRIGSDIKNTFDFEKQDDGTFKIKTTIARADNPSQAYLSTNKAGYDRNNYPVFKLWQSSGSGTKYWNWKLQKVTDTQLKKALNKLNLIKAYKEYNSTLAYSGSSTALINTITEEPADVYYGKGTQIFVSRLWLDDNTTRDGSRFTHITDATTTNNFFQSSLGGSTSTYADGTTTVEAPQFFQVDMEKSVKGIRMEMNATNYNTGGWCASSQWADVTLYATNDEDAAFNCYTIAQCEDNDQWVKIGEFEPDLSKSVIEKTKPNNKSNAETNTTTYYYWLSTTDENKVYNNLGLKDTGYRYVRFFVNNEPFPNTAVMNYLFTGFQLYELEDVAVINSKKYLVKDLLDKVSKAEASTATTTEFDALTDAIEAVEQNASVSISEIGYASFVSDENVKLATGLTAYIVTEKKDGYAILEKVADAGQTLPANTPVLIQGAEGDYVLPISTEGAVTIPDGNLLKGAARAITSQDDAYTYYVLTAKSSEEPTVPVIKRLKSGTKVPAGYAYLTLDATATSPAFLGLSFDSATGIQSAVNEESNKNVKTYDLEGRSVKNPQKGIYIRDGKKVILK